MRHSKTSREIARLSTIEIASALRATNAPMPIRGLVETLARVPSSRLGDILGRFDERTGAIGLPRAAREVLDRLGARLERDGPRCPRAGGVLVVSNHPGAYDALALMASLDRDDVMFIASDRAFLRAMPNVARHLIFVPDGESRLASVRAMLRLLREKHAVVQFGAGTIEPDARFVSDDTSLLHATWSEGTGWLARHAPRDASIVPCFVSGVHSPRAKRLRLVRWAERRGVTTIAPLIQAALPGFRDVVVRVRLGDPIARARLDAELSDQDRAEHLRRATQTIARS